jgi:vacuolar-type H+-ATPase subunit D/Vma8
LEESASRQAFLAEVQSLAQDAANLEEQCSKDLLEFVKKLREATRKRGKRTGKKAMIPQSHPLKRIDNKARIHPLHPSKGKGNEAMIRWLLQLKGTGV